MRFLLPSRQTQSRIVTVVVAVITSNLALAAAPGNVRLGRNVLTQRIRAVPGTTLRNVDEGLRLVLGL
ncbi:MAG: hypothetical protein OEY13_15685 [Gammaproteobacteria bacterium]|nr:hypothetical protein [Gammaproteobacteria bacterium]MDH4312068.1 hypothetical protein [Gammaproteobacteria bacterium]MDH5274502.1 hypothetical protein [Gammaproteobacteria bacterium]